MTTHLSTRLVWHDRAWDGHICDHPSENTSCIVQEQIRESLDDKREEKAGGVALADLKIWQPPCARGPIAFSPGGFPITHDDPLEHRQLTSVREDMPPYSVCPSPYRWLLKENFRTVCEDEKLSIRTSDTPGKESGWVYEPDRQPELLRHFWGKLEKNKSLLFLYCNHGNPLDESPNRILLGFSRISQIGPQLFFGKKLPKFAVADILTSLGASFEHEQKLSFRDDPNEFRLSDFTVSYEGDTFYWEHLGMLSVPSYKEAWNRKRQWYEDNGYLDRIITSEDGGDGSIDAAEIERIARDKILMEV